MSPCDGHDRVLSLDDLHRAYLAGENVTQLQFHPVRELHASCS